MQAAAGGHLFWTYGKHMLTRSSPAVPVKSHFEQVHLVRRFGASNLVKTPFCGNIAKVIHKYTNVMTLFAIADQWNRKKFS